MRKWLSSTWRSCDCGSLQLSDAGKRLRLAGWVQSLRPSGDVVFVGLRDAFGVTQVVVPSSEAPRALSLRGEDIVQVEGVVSQRPQGMENNELLTGQIELVADTLQLVNPVVEHPTSIPVERYLNVDAERNKKGKSRLASAASPEQKLKHRFLDIRGVTLQRNLRVRAASVLAARNALSNEKGFIEVETPVLFKSTPEGAREFLVPTRHQPPGTCYALTQSPQQYKQLLMAGGVDRYFQFAKCFRDEGGRADRQPEFTQLDLEMSFASTEDIREVTNFVVAAMWLEGYKSAKACAMHSSVPRSPEHEAEWIEDNIPLPLRLGEAFFSKGQVDIPIVSYNEVIEKYGSDKPDTRFGLEISDTPQRVLCETSSRFNPVIRVLPLRKREEAFANWKPSRKELEKLCDESSDQVGIAVVRVGETDRSWGKMHFGPKVDDTTKSFFVNLPSDLRQQVLDALDVEPEDILVFGMSHAGSFTLPWRQRRDAVCSALGRIRLQLANTFIPLSARQGLEFLWVVDFPLFEVAEEASDPVKSNEDGSHSLQAVHHPFTMPHPDDVGIVQSYRHEDGVTDEILSVRGQHYDLVCNGMELGGGSVRVHSCQLQRHIFKEVLGIPEEKVELYFGHLLKALGSGCPPHAGIALGVDRMMSILCDTPSIREVIAFPKSAAGNELMTGAPTQVDAAALAEYNLQVLESRPSSTSRAS